MTTQQSRSAALTRIRNNQRRSRARRKEYIGELEDRVQRLERIGPQANAEIQAAARGVLAENALLRSLLGDLSVPITEVETYLHATHGGPENTSPVSVCLPTMACPPHLAPVPNATQHLMDLGTSFLHGGPSETRQGVHALQITPSCSTGRSTTPSRPAWGPASQYPRDMPPFSLPDEAPVQPPRAGDALDSAGTIMRWNRGRSQSVESAASYAKAAVTTAGVCRRDAGGVGTP